MTTELWPVGTWVADTKDGIAFLVTNHSKAMSQVEGMDLQEHGYWYAAGWVTSKAHYTELPPIPDEKALADQGYRLTGMASDCREESVERAFVTAYANMVCDGDYVSCNDPRFQGWRWLVERIETDIDASEQRIQDSEQEYLASVESPWIDASERTPEDTRYVLCKVNWETRSRVHTGFWPGEWFLLGPKSDVMRCADFVKTPSSIQWMEIPE